MKVSDILKKISTMQDAQIRITFKENRYDPDPVTECLEADTPDDIKIQAIERGKEYSVVDIEVWQDALTITAVKIPKRTPKPKREKPEPAAGQAAKDDRLKEDIKELEALRDNLITEIGEIVDKLGRNVEKAGKVSKTIFRKARAAVARFLTRIFRKDRKTRNGNK